MCENSWVENGLHVLLILPIRLLLPPLALLVTKGKNIQWEWRDSGQRRAGTRGSTLENNYEELSILTNARPDEGRYPLFPVSQIFQWPPQRLPLPGPALQA